TITLNRLAQVYLIINRAADAEHLLNESLPLVRVHLGRDANNCATVLAMLAMARMDQGRYDSAADYLQEAQVIYEHHNNADSEGVILCLGEFIRYYRDTARPDDKTRSLRRLREFAKDDPSRLCSAARALARNLAGVSSATGATTPKVSE